MHFLRLLILQVKDSPCKIKKYIKSEIVKLIRKYSLHLQSNGDNEQNSDHRSLDIIAKHNKGDKTCKVMMTLNKLCLHLQSDDDTEQIQITDRLVIDF